MSNVDQNNPYATFGMDVPVAQAPANVRAKFIMKTYFTLLFSVIAFALIETALIGLTSAEFKGRVLATMFGSQYSWLIVLVLFMVVSSIASRIAMKPGATGLQYAGLALFIVAESIIILPLLIMAFYQQQVQQSHIIASAAGTTLGLFGALTLVVFFTRYDFSFLRSIVAFGVLAAMGFVVVAVFTGFTLGPIFIYAMIALMCCSILYQTSDVLHHYHESQHVAAALGLFASLATLFWYILMLFMSRE